MQSESGNEILKVSALEKHPQVKLTAVVDNHTEHLQFECSNSENKCHTIEN